MEICDNARCKQSHIQFRVYDYTETNGPYQSAFCSVRCMNKIIGKWVD